MRCSVTAVLKKEGELSRRMSHEHVIDAKSVFDSLIKETAGSKQDRRTAIELAIVREVLQGMSSKIKWVPHPLMPADTMTHADPAKSNDAFVSSDEAPWFEMKKQ